VAAVYSQYGGLINGFFIDEMSVLPTTLSYYQSLNAYIKGLQPSYLTVGNPGEPFLNGVSVSDYLSVADVLDIFEGPNTGAPGTSGYNNYPYGLNWFLTQPSQDFANIVYNTPDTASMLADINTAIALNSGDLFITDQGAGGANPYAALPSYWNEEVAAIDALPEPGTASLLGLGFAAMDAFARRRELSAIRAGSNTPTEYPGKRSRNEVDRRDRTPRAGWLKAAFSGLALTVFATGTVDANLLINGGFETGDISGWTASSNYELFVCSSSFNVCAGDTVSVVSGSQAGSYYLGDGYPSSLATISQSFADQVGATYQVTGWVASDGGTPDGFTLSAGGVVFGSENPAPRQNWTEFTGVFVGTGFDTLTIATQNGPHFNFFDSFDVEPLPEAPGWTVMLAGLTGIALVRRRACKGAA
jgi:hypothetical protein